MTSGHRRKSVAFFIVLGACLTAGAVALNIGWVIVNWRQAGMLILGLIVFPLIITGVVLNTIFLVREIRRNEQHDAFINAVTHELKTPVASIRLYLQTLQRRDIDEAKRQEFYQVMVEDTDRLLSTIEQALRAGRLGARVRRATSAPVDLSATVRECLALARTRHHLPEEALAYRESLVDGAPPRVLGDQEELKAVVSNLLDNAIKYSGSEVRVAVELEQPEPTRATLRVRDQGVGISPGELKRIFKRFYRVPGAVAMRVKGTGLGLFIVRSVIARHGGKVFAESEGSGRGSTFTVQLPLMPPP
ncbi:MAG: two-component sensor histidine kinase [Acidobacteria bacterium RIFCSPLOWO2_12_FULL_66_10]|nr:MAG: two-component sensor histidine kinase [Acidobacteria bacterium RIFCSPLOWO2_12_FULL_66_10]